MHKYDRLLNARRDFVLHTPRLNQSGPTLIILAEHKDPVYGTGGLKLVTSSVRRFPPDCLDAKIHHANLIQSIQAKMQATAAGADDALMLDTRGFVAETNTTHVFLVRRETLATPHTYACPEGITRRTVLELCEKNAIPCEVGDLTTTDVYTADEMFCTGTMGELVWVASVDGRTIGSREVGPMTTRLVGLFARETTHNGYPVVSPELP